MLKLIASDIDDTIVPHKRQPSGYSRLVEEGKQVLNRYPRLVFSAITGQPYEASKDVTGLIGIGPHFYEGGLLIGCGGAPPQRNEHLYAREEVNAVDELRRRMLSNGIDTHLEGTGIKIIRDKNAMLSFSFDGVTTTRDFLDHMLPKLLERYTNDAFQALLNEGRIKLLNPGYAVDIVATDKADALSHRMQELGIVPNEIVVFVDSAHSDYGMLDLVKDKGYAACPNNAGDEVKGLVRSMGHRGYISQKSCRDGAFMDLLRQAERWGLEI